MFKPMSVCVLCIVFVGPQAFGAPRPFPDGQSAIDQQSEIDKKSPEPHVTEGRVKINLPSLDMTVAQANKIPLDLHGFAVSRIMEEWKFSEPGIEGESIAEPEELPLERAADGSTYVNFIPLRLGKLQLRILVDFEDGGFDDDSVEVNVNRLPDRPPTRVILSDPVVRVDFTRKAGTLHIDFSPDANTEYLIPVAFYRGVASPIPLIPTPNSVQSQISYTIIPRKNQAPPIAFDKLTGKVEAVRVGQALVKVTLESRFAYACVDVMKDVHEFNERSNCESFLPPGLTEPIDEPLYMNKPVTPQPH